MSERRDVLVIGGGPAGSTAARLLAGQGFRVTLVDRARFPRPKPCGEYMSPGTVDLLARLGMAAVLDGARPAVVRGMEIVAPSGKTLPVEYSAAGDRTAVSVPRVRLDEALLRAAERSGVEIREACSALAPRWEDGRVAGARLRQGDREFDLDARLTVVADGARSGLARALALERSVRWPLRLGLMAYFEGEPALPEGFGQMHVAAGGYCGVAPLPDGRVNVAVVTRADAVRRAGMPAGRYFSEWIASHPALCRTLAGCRQVSPLSGRFPIGARSSGASAAGALLVGDAAGFFDPFTGEGIFRALRGAELAADVAANALSAGDTGAKRLREYDRRRREAFRSKAAVSALVQLFVQFPPLLEYAVPRLQRRDRPRTALNLVLGDLSPARAFLRPDVLWAALQP